jgi:TRAP-type C4-dicarboxylate transport system permease small subunit
MGPLDLLDHLLNFVAPALFVAVLLALAARVLVRRAPASLALWKQMALNFLAGLAVLLGGLAVLGRDGKMATYAALVIVCATSQWLLLRGWRK